MSVAVKRNILINLSRKAEQGLFKLDTITTNNGEKFWKTKKPFF